MITATASTQPLVEADWPAAGTYITALGADDAGKVELAPGCVARADLVVVDSRELTALYGDLAYAERAGIQPKAPPIELGELIDGRVPGRTDDEQITVCKLLGLGVQDLAAANATLARLAGQANADRRPASGRDLSPR